MPSQEVQTLIIGGGVAGLSCAWHLGQAGAAREGRVLLLEKEPLCGSQASAQNAAILRSFSADPVTSAIARASAAFLRQPPAGFSPVPLLNPTGLILGASGPTAKAWRLELERLGPAAGARQLSKAELQQLAPHLKPSAELLLYFESEGQIDIAAELDGFRRGAKASGVRIQTDQRITRLLRQEERVLGVELEDGSSIHAQTTVLAAGGWSDALGQSVHSRVRMSPTRRHLMVSAPDPTIERNWPIVWLEDAGFYCRPESGGLLVSACDTSEVDPDALQRDPAILESFASKVARHTPRFAGSQVAHYWCGMRTQSPDGRFCLGPDPDLAGLFWVAALGGHGMTCGPEVGRLASALLLERGDREDPQVLQSVLPGRSIPLFS